MSKPPAEFYRSSSKASGRQSTCKACQDASKRQRYAANPTHQATLRRARYVAARDDIRAYSRGWYARNAESQRARTQRWRDENPEKVKAQRAKYDPKKAYAAAQRYRAAHPEWLHMVRQLDRARRRAATVLPIAKDQLTAKWDYWGGLCWMCGGGATTWDHVKPITRGGLHCLANLRPACRSCNSRKKNTWPWPVRD